MSDNEQSLAFFVISARWAGGVAARHTGAERRGRRRRRRCGGDGHGAGGSLWTSRAHDARWEASTWPLSTPASPHDNCTPPHATTLSMPFAGVSADTSRPSSDRAGPRRPSNRSVDSLPCGASTVAAVENTMMEAVAAGMDPDWEERGGAGRSAAQGYLSCPDKGPAGTTHALSGGSGSASHLNVSLAATRQSRLALVSAAAGTQRAPLRWSTALAGVCLGKCACGCAYLYLSARFPIRRRGAWLPQGAQGTQRRLLPGRRDSSFFASFCVPRAPSVPTANM